MMVENEVEGVVVVWGCLNHVFLLLSQFPPLLPIFPPHFASLLFEFGILAST